MLEITPLSSELLRQLVLWLSVGLPGLPPGATDAQLVQAIPADAVIAITWAGRGEGIPGAAGLSGAMADPEIHRAAEALRSLARFTTQLEQELTDDLSAAPNQSSWELADMLLAHPGCCFVALGPPDWSSGRGLLSMFRAGLVINPGEASDAVLTQLRHLVPPWMLYDKTNDADKDISTTGLLQHRRFDSRLVWGLGDVLPGIEQRLTGDPATSSLGGLGQSARFQELQAQAAVEQPGCMVWLQLPGPAAQLAVSALGLPANAQSQIQSGLQRVGAVQMLAISGIEDGHVVSRAAIHGGGLAKLTGNLFRPIPPESLRRVPADAHVVAALGCDLFTLVDRVLAGLSTATSGTQDDAAARRLRWEAQLGVPLDQQLSKSFGPVWVVSSSPSTGGAYGLGPVCSLEVRDPRSAHATFTQLMTWLQQSLPQSDAAAPRLTTEMFQDRMLYTLQYRDRFAGGIAPCFCITDAEVLVTLQPQTMRAHLRFLEQGGPTFADRQTDQPQLSAGVVAGLYVDAPRFTEVIWPLLPTAANAHLNRLSEFGLGIDANVWPSTSALLKYSRPVTATIRPTEFGCVCEIRNPLSLAAPLLAGAALVALQRIDLPHADSGSLPAAMDIDLGVPEGVDQGPPGNLPPADASKVIRDDQVKPATAVESPAARTARELAPALIRAFTPDDVEFFIPAEVFRRLEAGPDPVRQQERLERRRQRAKAREAAPEQ